MDYHSAAVADVAQALKSTPAGLELYRRLGYEARTRITVWVTE